MYGCATETIALYYGSYLSQDRVRGATGGHSGKHEIMLGRGGCCAAVDVFAHFRLNVSQWPYWSAAQPQHVAFVNWMADAIEAGEPTGFGVFMQTEDNPTFDHIVPLVGVDRERRSLVFNDLHSNVSLHEDLDTFVATRAECRRALPWGKRFAYCLPAKINYGLRVHGNVDPDGVLLRARLRMDDWNEPDYSVEDGKGEAPTLLSASVLVSQLRPGALYSLLKYTDAALVPASNFLANITRGCVSRVDFTATSSGTYQRRVAFMSNATVIYRVVNRPSPILH